MADGHIVPRGDTWQIEHDGATVDSFATQQEAIDAGRSVAADESCELVIHGQVGSIRAQGGEGNDPRGVPG